MYITTDTIRACIARAQSCGRRMSRRHPEAPEEVERLVASPDKARDAIAKAHGE